MMEIEREVMELQCEVMEMERDRVEMECEVKEIVCEVSGNGCERAGNACDDSGNARWIDFRLCNFGVKWLVLNGILGILKGVLTCFWVVLGIWIFGGWRGNRNADTADCL
ncbi:MAG: hypothetical protein WCL14_12420 [Bacteroidota bacterium]